SRGWQIAHEPPPAAPWWWPRAGRPWCAGAPRGRAEGWRLRRSGQDRSLPSPAAAGQDRSLPPPAAAGQDRSLPSPAAAGQARGRPRRGAGSRLAFVLILCENKYTPYVENNREGGGRAKMKTSRSPDSLPQ